MHKLQTVLRAAGMDFENVVWMNIYLTDAHDQAALDDVYWKMIGSSPPARTVLTVAALPHGEKIEINCIAVADAGERKAIWPAGWPRGPHLDPPAIVAGEILYLSAQGGQDPLTGKAKSRFFGGNKASPRQCQHHSERRANEHEERSLGESLHERRRPIRRHGQGLRELLRVRQYAGSRNHSSHGPSQRSSTSSSVALPDQISANAKRCARAICLPAKLRAQGSSMETRCISPLKMDSSPAKAW